MDTQYVINIENRDKDNDVADDEKEGEYQGGDDDELMVSLTSTLLQYRSRT